MTRMPLGPQLVQGLVQGSEEMGKGTEKKGDSEVERKEGKGKNCLGLEDAKLPPVMARTFPTIHVL